jgi:threonine synthase
MKFYSTNNKSYQVSFEEAVFKSLPPDNGLFYPTDLPQLDPSWLQNLKAFSKVEIGLKVSSQFISDEIPLSRLEQIIEETIDFDIPLINISDQIASLELFHGPTWAFKDVGARFLSRCMAYFIEGSSEETTILVATSGDTGGAVASGFFNIPGIKVKILYPKGKVSKVQRKQLTTWGGNINAYEVAGTFDDCQRLVKQSFLDKDLNKVMNLSSANSINIARLIPQSFYYFYAIQQSESEHNVVCVPSGNYGNLTAGLWAWSMGLPIERFIAASNANSVVPEYLNTGIYKPVPSIQTYANAMDVGAPSNFVRMMELFGDDHSKMEKYISGFSLSDDEILTTIRTCRNMNNYVLDPHGAIGYQALVKNLKPNERGIFLETAHPVKFLDVVNKALQEPVNFDEKLLSFFDRKEVYQIVTNDFPSFKEQLISTIL